MKCAFILAALPALASAWTFSWGGNVDQGSSNRGCKVIDMAAGTKFDWDRGNFESCCIRMYNDASCKGQQIGISCPDWSKNAGQFVKSYQVTNC